MTTTTDFIEAFQIFDKHLPTAEYKKIMERAPDNPHLNEKHLDTWAEHDIFGVGLTAEDIDPKSEDGKRLEELGWFVSEEYDVWMKYV